jgi:hypothetical protein
MQAVPTLPKPEKPAPRHPMLAPMLVLVAIIAAITLGGRYLPSSSFLGKGVVLHQTASGWERLPAPSGVQESIRVSGRGTVWMSALMADELSRLEGTRWRSFSKVDFGGRIGHLRGGFVLDGDNLWAAASEGVLRWDGRVWSRYRDAVASLGATSIAAGGGRVWVIDNQGNLSEFDGARWTIRKLELPGVNWPARGASPKLARTADGALWLVRDGVWRFDGAHWTAVVPQGKPLTKPRLIGATDDRIWLRTGETLRSVSADGKAWAAYPAVLKAHAAASAGGRTWITADGGILESEGQGWRRLNPPSDGVKSFSSLAAGPDGRLWALGLTPGPLAALPWVGSVVIVALPLALLAALVWMLRRKSQHQRREIDRIEQAVAHATGEVPYELQQFHEKQAAASNPWRVGLILAVAIGGGVASFFALRRWWPNAPAWTILVFVVLIDLAIRFQQSLAKRKPKPSDPIGPGGPSRYDWGKTAKALLGGAVLIILLSVPHLSGYWILVVIVLPPVYQTLGVKLMASALRRGDYDGALRIVRLFHFYSPEGAGSLRLCGHVLLLAGRYREAEDSLRRAIAGLRSGLEQAMALQFLADALMEQGRYDEAMRSYEAALQAVPGYRRPYRGMAEMTLRQAKNPQQALEYVENILGSSGLAWPARGINGRPQDDYWALKAWALAQFGRSGEVAPAIEEAFKATNKKSLIDLALTNYRAGMAMQAIGNQSSANDYFKRARDLDPHGRCGILAQAALRQRSVWGAGV